MGCEGKRRGLLLLDSSPLYPSAASNSSSSSSLLSTLLSFAIHLAIASGEGGEKGNKRDGYGRMEEEGGWVRRLESVSFAKGSNTPLPLPPLPPTDIHPLFFCSCLRAANRVGGGIPKKGKGKQANGEPLDRRRRRRALFLPPFAIPS